MTDERLQNIRRHEYRPGPIGGGIQEAEDEEWEAYLYVGPHMPGHHPVCVSLKRLVYFETKH